ncbi:carboxymuconolactone decarboxylase family protein [Yinghuangia aomiensis]
MVLDPRTTELVRLRIAQLHERDAELAVRNRPAVDAGLDDTKLAALTRGGGDPAFDAVESACLDFAEQFVMAPGGVSDEDRKRLTELLGMPHVMASWRWPARVRRLRLVQRRARHPHGHTGHRCHRRRPAWTRPVGAATPPPTDPRRPDRLQPLRPAAGSAGVVPAPVRDARSNGVVDHASKEVARLRNARVTDCRFCRAVRYDQATAAGSPPRTSSNSSTTDSKPARSRSATRR